MTLSPHLGERVAALVDGELDHEARDRALAHLAHCSGCRAEVEAQRAVKELLRQAGAPRPDAGTLADLLALAAPGGPLPPRARSMPLAPLVPELPPPSRWRARNTQGPALRSTGPTRPAGRGDRRRPGSAVHRPARRMRLVAAGTLSAAGLVLGTAFVAGGSTGSGPGDGSVVPPVAELSVEHSRTSTAVTVGDPGLGLMTTVGRSAGSGSVGTGLLQR